MHDDAHPQAPRLTKITRSSSRSWAGKTVLAGFLGSLLCVFLWAAPENAWADPQFSDREAENQLKRANQFFAKGEYGSALGLYDRLKRIEPRRDVFWFNYAGTLSMLGRYPEAIVAYRRAIRLNGKLVNPAVLYLAETYRLQGDTPRARTAISWLLKRRDLPPHLLEEALMLASRLDETLRSRDDYNELVNQGIWRYKNGKWADAYSFFNGALQIQRTPQALFLLALAQIELGRIDEAEILLQEIRSRAEDEELSRAAVSILEGARTLRKTRLYLNLESEAAMAQSNFRGGVERTSYESANSARVGYRLLELEEWLLTLRYRFRWRQQLSPVGTTLFTNSLGALAGYDVDDWVAQFNLDFEVNGFPDEIFLYRTLAGWGVGHKWRHARLMLGFQAIASNVPPQAYSYLNGKTAIAKLDWIYFWDAASLGLVARYALDNLGDSVLSDDSIIPISNRKLEIGETLRIAIGRYWSIKQGMQVARKLYVRTSRPDNKQRRDFVYTGNLGLEFRSQVPWIFDVGLAYLENHSSLTETSASNQRFNEFQVRANLLWDLKP